jgi:hypothetical protein
MIAGGVLLAVAVAASRLLGHDSQPTPTTTPTTGASVRATTAVPSATTTSGTASASASTPSALVATGEQQFIDCRSGDDAADGSSEHPWRTLDPLRSRPVAADTAVFLRRGCSWGGGLKLTDASQRVSLGAYGTGDAPTLTGDGVSRDFPVVDVEAEGVMLSGLHIRNAEAVGLKLSAADVTVDGLEIDDVAFGMTVQAPRATITRTAVHDLHLLINTPGGSDDTGAVGFDVQADDVSITASSCTNCRAPSYDFGHDGGFAEIYNHGDRLRLIGNTARNVQGILEIGGVVDDGGAHDVVLENNTFNETFGGIWIHEKDEFSIPVGTVTLRGNTIVNSDKGVTMGGKVGALVLQDNTIAVPGHVSTGGEPAEHTGNRYYLTRPALLGFRAHGTETISTYDSYPR